MADYQTSWKLDRRLAEELKFFEAMEKAPIYSLGNPRFQEGKLQVSVIAHEKMIKATAGRVGPNQSSVQGAQAESSKGKERFSLEFLDWEANEHSTACPCHGILRCSEENQNR